MLPILKQGHSKEGIPIGLNVKGDNKGIETRYQKISKKEKRDLFDEFTWLTGYRLKSAVGWWFEKSLSGENEVPANTRHSCDDR
jgi:hypothetical protein